MSFLRTYFTQDHDKVWLKYRDPIYKTCKAYWIDTHPKDIGEETWNYLFTGGKQIRPNLFCELWKYLSPETPVRAEVAFVIECIHVVSMVLDDSPWMDNSSERRGKKTLHVSLSPKKSMLIAYEALEMVADLWKQNCPPSFTDREWVDFLRCKMERLMVGQWFDLEKRGDLVSVASLKTGVLFELVTEVVAIYLDLDRDFWREWGSNLGILMQWVDDWDDREEDRITDTRNAFNEEHEDTVMKFTYLWHKIQTGIGDFWFQENFGKWMKEYFTGNLEEVQASLRDGKIQSFKMPVITIESVKDFETNTNSLHAKLVQDKIGARYSNVEFLKIRSVHSTKLYFNFLSGKDMMEKVWSYVDQTMYVPETGEVDWKKQIGSATRKTPKEFWNYDESTWEEQARSRAPEDILAAIPKDIQIPYV